MRKLDQPTIIWGIVVIFICGGAWASLESKVDASQARKIAKSELVDHALPLVEGERIKARITALERNVNDRHNRVDDRLDEIISLVQNR